MKWKANRAGQVIYHENTNPSGRWWGGPQKSHEPECRIFRHHDCFLVEDHPINQKVAKKMLEKAGARVIGSGENGKIGWGSLCREQRMNMMSFLMDIQMPVMDGLEPQRRYGRNRHPQAKTIPIIAMTTNAFIRGMLKRSLDISMDPSVLNRLSRRNYLRPYSGVCFKIA